MNKKVTRGAAAQQPKPNRYALLVLGMHRSGTSAVTRTVSLLGAQLPRKLMVPKSGENEHGFWESTELYDLLEALLASGGSSWDDWRPFNPGWLDSPAARPLIDRLVDYVRADFADAPLFVVKDPRSCRLMPVWRRVLETVGAEPRVLLPVRNPMEVAESLRKRNGFSLAKGYIIWLRHVLDAERHSRDIPRLIFNYDQLLLDWRLFAAQSSEALGIAWPSESPQTAARIDAFLDSRHRHHTIGEDHLLTHPAVSDWVKRTYRALKLLTQEPASEAAIILLDEIRTEFDYAGESFGDVIATEELISQQLQSQLLGSESTRQDQQAQIQLLESQVVQLRDERSGLEASYAAQLSELAVTQAACRDKAVEVVQLQSELEATQAAFRDRTADAAHLQSELNATQAAFRDRVGECARLQTELNASHAANQAQAAESDRLQTELNASHAANQAQAAESDRLQTELNASHAALQEKTAESDRLQSELHASQALFQNKAEESTNLLRALTDAKYRYERERAELLSRLQHERMLKEQFAFQRSRLLSRLSAILVSGTWRLAEPAYDLELRRPWLVRGLSTAVVAARGLMRLHPFKYWRLHWDARVVQKSGLFDWPWYIEHNADVVAAGIDPLKHWLSIGWKEGRWPNPHFDTAGYVGRYLSDSNGTNPLLHYIREHTNPELEPNSSFNTRDYLQQHPEITQGGMIPLTHFLAHQEPFEVPDQGHDPLGHEPVSLEDILIGQHVDGATRGCDCDRDIDTARGVGEGQGNFGAQASTGLDAAHKAFVETIRISQQAGPLYENERPHPTPDPQVRAIAFYLPQFHPIPENDKNWGKGFTEWNNTARTLPRFAGHYQPRMPGELGYYDLRNYEIHRRQIELAKANGIAGFCYHHYWFNGKKVLRMPIERHLADPTFDLGFCINWANEPWTARWDGHRESGVLVEQSHSPEDDLAFIRDIEPFLRDPRYIRVGGKPLLSIYRPALFPDMRATIARWQDYCMAQGIGELFIVMVQSFEDNDPRPYGFNGAIEFPPHNAARESYASVEFFPNITEPGVWDYKVMAEYSRNRPAEDFPWFRGVTLSWDNSARKQEGWVFHGCDPDSYGDWLQGQCNNAMEELEPGQRLVFINAWNEWAEGTYLEPDAHFGYAFLNRTGEVLQQYRMTGVPNQALLDYITARHDENAAQWLTRHFIRFGLPVTSAEVELAEPTDSDMASWLEELVAVAGRNAHRLSATEPDVSILIPVYNQFRYTISCLVSLLSHPGKYSMELIIGDDCSTDATSRLETLSIPGLCYIRHPHNLGFLKNCNAIAERARGRCLVMLNNDTVTLPEWLDTLIGTLEGEDDVGLVGSKLVYPDGRLQEAGGIMWEDASGLNWGNLKDPLDPEFNYRREVDYCSGASIALSARLWRELEGFDGGRYQNAYYEDTDLAFRVREDKKLRVIYQPLSHLLHFEGVSSGRSLDAGVKKFQRSNQPVFVERWRDVLAAHGTAERHPDNFLCRSRRKNLLLIDWITPMPDQDSGSADTYNYLKIFVQMGYSVTLLPEKNTPTDRYVKDLQGLGVRVLHEPYVNDFAAALAVEVPKADVIFIYRGPAHNHLPLVRRLAPDTPIVFDTVDLHFLREEREAQVIGTAAARLEAAETKRKELQAMALSSATIVLSEYEETLLHQIVPDVTVARIPIVREIPGRSSRTHAQRSDVLFIGGFLHKPNVHAVQYFVKEVWPLVRRLDLGRPCRFVIAGSNIPPEIEQLSAADIEIRGFVENLSDVFDNVLLSVSPLQYGAGLKGKVVSSLSYGVPVVCTSISAEGSGLEHGKNVAITDTPSAMCDYIAELHRNPDLWQKLSDNGLEFCTRNFSLQAVGAKLGALLRQLNVPA